MPPITQPLHAVTQAFELGLHTSPAPHVVVPGEQLSVASLHVSVPLHVTASAQKLVAELPAQRPPEQLSAVVQKSPSSQLAPSFALKAARDRAVSQTSQGFAGLRVAFA